METEIGGGVQMKGARKKILESLRGQGDEAEKSEIGQIWNPAYFRGAHSLKNTSEV